MTSSSEKRRVDFRKTFDLRPVSMQPSFHTMSEGSVLYRSGKTVVLCTASIDEKVPSFLEGKNKAWITADYQMHPRSNPQKRESRDGRGKTLSGRAQEIQRLIGRALRACVDLSLVGERQITIDCDVLEADGGTRTASITGGFVALALALDTLYKRGLIQKPVLYEPLAAVSSGLLKDSSFALDLCYAEDSEAEVDLNVVATESGKIVEIQGTSEGQPVARDVFDKLIELSLHGIKELTLMQRAALEAKKIDLSKMFVNLAKR